MKKRRKLLLLSAISILSTSTLAITSLAAAGFPVGENNIGENVSANIIDNGDGTYNITVHNTGSTGKIKKNKWENLLGQEYSKTKRSKIANIVIENNVLFPDDSSGLFRNFSKANIQIDPNINTSNVNNMSGMFKETKNANPDVSNWDVSNVTDFSEMFSKAKNAEPVTTNWITSKATDMGFMFENTEKANPDVSNWDVSKVVRFSKMFHKTKSAEPDTANWDTSSAIYMGYMFSKAEKANPKVATRTEGNKTYWDVSNVTSMEGMFSGAKKAEAITSNWNTSKVTNMSFMFYNASIVTPDTSSWDTSQVTNFSYMFSGTKKAEPDTSNWDTSKAENMRLMFSIASKANPNTSNWDVSNVTDFAGMFWFTNLAEPDTSNWDTSKATDMKQMFSGAQKANPNVSSWDVSQVTDFSEMFSKTPKANPDVSNWDTSKATDMRRMFNNALVATPNTSNWDVSQVTDFSEMFSGAKKADPNVTNWNVSQAKDFTDMFKDTEKANPDISSWDPQSINSDYKVRGMFLNAHSARLDFTTNNNKTNIETLYSYLYENYSTNVQNNKEIKMLGEKAKTLLNSKSTKITIFPNTENGIFLESEPSKKIMPFDEDASPSDAQINSLDDNIVYIFKNYTAIDAIQDFKYLNKAQKDAFKKKIKDGEDANSILQEATNLDNAMKDLGDAKTLSNLDEFVLNITNLADTSQTDINTLNAILLIVLEKTNAAPEANKDINDVQALTNQLNNLLTATINQSLTEIDNLTNLNQAQKDALKNELNDPANATAKKIGDILVRARNLNTKMSELKDKKTDLLDKLIANKENLAKQTKQYIEKLNDEISKVIDVHNTDNEANIDSNKVEKLINKISQLFNKAKYDIKTEIDTYSTIDVTRRDTLKNDAQNAPTPSDLVDVFSVAKDEYLATSKEAYDNIVKNIKTNVLSNPKYQILIDAFDIENKPNQDIRDTINPDKVDWANDINNIAIPGIKDISDKLNKVIPKFDALNEKRAEVQDIINNLPASSEYNKARNILQAALDDDANKNEEIIKIMPIFDTKKWDTAIDNLNIAINKSKTEPLKEKLQKTHDDAIKWVNDSLDEPDKTKFIDKLDEINNKGQTSNNVDVIKKAIIDINNTLNDAKNAAKDKAKKTIENIKYLNQAQKDDLKAKVDNSKTNDEVNDVVSEAYELNKKMKLLNEANNSALQDFVNIKDKLPGNLKKVVEELNDEVGAVINTKNTDSKVNINKKAVQDLIDKINDLLNKAKVEANKEIDNLYNLNQAQGDALKDEVNNSKTINEIASVVSKAKELDKKMFELNKTNENKLQDFVNNKDKLPGDLKKFVEELNNEVQKVINKNNKDPEANKNKEEVQDLIDKINSLIYKAKEEANKEIDSLDNLNQAQKDDLKDKINNQDDISKINNINKDAKELDSKMNKLNEVANNDLKDMINSHKILKADYKKALNLKDILDQILKLDNNNKKVNISSKNVDEYITKIKNLKEEAHKNYIENVKKQYTALLTMNLLVAMLEISLILIAIKTYKHKHRK